MALLGEGRGEVQRGGGLGDAALLVGERDDLGLRGFGVTADSDLSGCSAGTAAGLRSKRPIAVRIRTGGSDSFCCGYCCGPPDARASSTSGCSSSPARAAWARRPSPPRSASPPRARAAHDGLRGRAPGAHVAGVPARGRRLQRDASWRRTCSPSRSTRSARWRSTCACRSSRLRSTRSLFDNRIFQYFAAATPGMRELVTIGKVWELAQLERRNADDRALRPRDRRRAGDRPRPRHAAHAGAPSPTSRASGRSAPGRAHRRLHQRPAHRRRRGRAARGDAGQRDARLRSAGCAARWA